MHIKRNEHEQGAVILEAALAIGFSLFLLILGADILRIGYIKTAGQYVVHDTARWASYGHQVSGAERTTLIKQRAQELAARLALLVDEQLLQVCPIEDPECIDESAAGPQRIAVLQMTYPVQLLLLPEATFNLTFTSAFSNEPF